jgi:hypothetical protein
MTTSAPPAPLDRKYLDCNTGCVVAEEHPAVPFSWIVRWRLVEGEATVPDSITVVQFITKWR